MKKLVLLGLVALSLTSCAGHQTVSHQWKGQSELDQDILECNMYAMQMSSGLANSMSGARMNSFGNQDYLGLSSLGNTIAIAGTRHQAYNDCLKAKGWR